VIAGFVRGLSVRDVEATLAEALGAQAALSKSTVSRICQQVADEFEAWRTRRLDLLSLDYLFLDASHFRMHPGSPATPILVAWGITTEGKPVLVGLEAAASESTDAICWNVAPCPHRFSITCRCPNVNTCARAIYPLRSTGPCRDQRPLARTG
jgi:transposase-like protein